MRCQGVTAMGKKCKREAQAGSKYCWSHNKGRTTQKRTRCCGKKLPTRMTKLEKNQLPLSAFCGKEAGKENYRTYPVTSKEQALKVLEYSAFAPDPENLRKCVKRKAKQHGWF